MRIKSQDARTRNQDKNGNIGAIYSRKKFNRAVLLPFDEFYTLSMSFLILDS